MGSLGIICFFLILPNFEKLSTLYVENSKNSNSWETRIEPWSNTHKSYNPQLVNHKDNKYVVITIVDLINIIITY
jgi:hypothetical protein